MKVKKKIRFLKKRICPVLIALVIVFFSVVIPCAKVEASSIVVPAPTAGFTYYDLVSTAFLSTGFDCPLEKSDGTRTTFGQEMYDELCDTFELWCNDNFGTTNADEIKAQLRALPGNVVNGAVKIGKDLWEGLKGFASDAYDKAIDYLASFSDASAKDASFVDSYGNLTWDFVKSVTGCIPSIYKDQGIVPIGQGRRFVIGKGMTLDGEFCYFLASSKSLSQNIFCIKRNSNSLGINFSGYWTKETYIWSTSGNPILHEYDYNGGDLSDCYVLCTNCMSIEYSGSGSTTSVSVPGLADSVVWPKQDLGVDKVANPTWEDAITAPDVIVVEGEDAITIPLVNTGEDSAVIPGTAVDDPAVDDPAVDDPAVDNPADEAVSSDDIAALPDKIASAGDVTTLFPFCIPFDIVALIKGMKAEKEVPVWEFKYHFEAIDYTFEVTIDMTDYEAYVKIFRSGFVIFYIIALMLFTIRYSSGIVKD